MFPEKLYFENRFWHFNSRFVLKTTETPVNTRDSTVGTYIVGNPYSRYLKSNPAAKFYKETFAIRKKTPQCALLSWIQLLWRKNLQRPMQQETKDPFRKSETELKLFLKQCFKKCFSFKWRSQYIIWKLRCSANSWRLDQCL